MMLHTYNLPNTHYYPGNHSHCIPRQHSMIRPSKLLSMKTLDLLFTKLNGISMHDQRHWKIDQDFDRQPTFFIRRSRAVLESLLPSQQRSDIDEVFGNPVQLTVLPRSKSRTKANRENSFHPKSIKHTKTFSENTKKYYIKTPKSSSPLQIPIWCPSLPEKENTLTKIMRSKTCSVKPFDYSLKKEKTVIDLTLNINSESQKIGTPSSDTNKLTDVKDLFDTWETLESKFSNPSYIDDSLIAHCDSPSLTSGLKITNEQIDSLSNQQLLPTITSNTNQDFKRARTMGSKQHCYSIPLPPVFEYSDDEEV